MHRHGALLCVVAVCAIAAAACGSGASPASTRSASTAARASASPVATSRGSTGYARLRVGALTLIFSTPIPDVPAQARVIEDFRHAQALWDSSEGEHRLVTGVSDYIVGQARAHLAEAVRFAVVHDAVPAGADRLFKTTVTILGGASAVVATCDDGSRYEEKNLRTGHDIPQFAPQPGQDYLFESWRMALRSGRWAIDSFTVSSMPSISARHCQP